MGAYTKIKRKGIRKRHIKKELPVIQTVLAVNLQKKCYLDSLERFAASFV